MADGIYWFTDPGRIAQKVSLGAEQLSGAAEDIVRDVLKEGSDFMRDRIMTGGVEGGLLTGGPRANTYAMFDSVNDRVTMNGRGRVQGEFGYIDNPPGYTQFQERGTASPGIGIKGLHAMADALMAVEGKMEVAAERQLERIWNNIWS